MVDSGVELRLAGLMVMWVIQGSRLRLGLMMFDWLFSLSRGVLSSCSESDSTSLSSRLELLLSSRAETTLSFLLAGVEILWA